MKIEVAKIKEILLAENYITEEDIKEAEAFIGKNKTSFTDYLLQNNLISKELLGQAIAEFFKMPYADLANIIPPSNQVQKIPEEIAKAYRVVLFKEKEKDLIVTTDTPENKEIFAKMKEIFPDKNITFAYSLSEDLEAIFMYYQKSLDTRFSRIMKEEGKVVPEILKEIFNDAIAYKSSDIHFEPVEGYVRVRFRIDGVLYEAGRLPKEYYENVLNRIKVQSGLRIDEHFSTQDGSLQYKTEDKSIDFRTSIIPTVEGEKVVLRVLSSYVQKLSLNDLGLLPEQEQVLQKAASKPFGMIIVVGPTGAGKTTTLYGFLKLVNNLDVNITTIEDPVEYKMNGVNQIQANSQTNLTFAKGLRSIIRQDPDIILVGEIRDKETAEIAVNAALTGHLLYSTFHANDAATAIPRLLDMGVEPFLLASTLELIISQRLVRKICKECRVSFKQKIGELKIPNIDKIKEHFQEEEVLLYKGKGCQSCANSGYKGRTGIFEIIEITPAMQELMLGSPSTQKILQLAKEEGMRTLFENGIHKVRNGITTIEELGRVAES
jgi:type II secretory ATPase GspE/PulE/Tfp pilus assembly ATPase PilB-like protein